MASGQIGLGLGPKPIFGPGCNGGVQRCDGPGTAGEPQWDAERGTYIQWDGTNQRWMAYDQASGQWQPIS